MLEVKGGTRDTNKGKKAKTREVKWADVVIDWRKEEQMRGEMAEGAA